MAPETPALLPVGRGFRFDNFQSRVGIRADGRPPARYHLDSTSASETDMWLTLIAITLVVAIGFCAPAFVVQFEP
jgi:hypothetical protein